MAGFLDNKERIIDMVITNRGKLLLAQGKLKFKYWAAFDDEIDYRPYIAESGSLSNEDLVVKRDQLISDTPTREASLGYRLFNKSYDDRINVNKPLCTVPPGFDIVPTMTSSYTEASATVRFTQQEIIRLGSNKSDSESSLGILREDPTSVPVDVQYSKDSYQTGYNLDGFYVTMLVSASNGYVPQHHTLDEDSSIVFGPDLSLWYSKDDS